MFRKINLLILICLSCLVICMAPKLHAESPKPYIVTTTTTMISDLVKEIGGSQVIVYGLMGPGVDPHLYKATTSDLIKLKKASLIIYSGLHLEGKMQDIFNKHAKQHPGRIHVVTDAIPREYLLNIKGYANTHDPHVWFDVKLWILCSSIVLNALKTYDPDHAAQYDARAKIYKQKLSDLHAWIIDTLKTLPPSSRILVTSHDAFSYFGRAYGFEVVGLQGISTVTQAGLADVAKLGDFIRERNVKSIFVESSVSPKTIERISQDTGVEIGGELFSDAMGTPGDIEHGYDKGTYIGMIKHNVTTLINALK